MVAVLLAVLSLVAPLAGAQLASAQATRDPLLPPALREVADRRPVRVGWARGPASLIARTEGDEVVGWGYDIWTLMGVRGGFKVEHVVFDSVVEEVAALRAGDIDVAGALGPRPDLTDFAEPTRPLAWERLAFLAMPAVGESLPNDLAGRQVSALAGSPVEMILRERFPRAEVVPTGTTADEGLVALRSGQVDAYLVSLSLAVDLARSTELVVASRPSDTLPRLELSAWAPKGSPYLQIAEAARRSIPDVAISGVTLRATGFDLGPPPTAPGLTGPVLVTLAVAMGALVVIGGFVLVLRRRVRSATEQLQRVNASLEERVMLRTAELHLVNASLARFSRSVAHDLRNPITVIAGMVNLLRNHAVDEESQVKMLESIERSTIKLNEMISTMLTDAVQSGTDVVQLDGGAYEAWLRGAVAAEVVASGADIRIKAPPGLIDVDVSLLLKASLNLVGNALKYAVNPDGMRIEVGLVATGSKWVLSVDDNGPGMGGSTGIEALFERGVRGHDDDRGQGWGLADIRDLLREAGGSMSAGTSSLGGAHFSVVLPRVTDRAPDTSDGTTPDAGEAAQACAGGDEIARLTAHEPTNRVVS